MIAIRTILSKGRFGLAVVGVLLAVGAKPVLASEVSDPVLVRCAFDPGTGMPDPLGMRALITLEQTAHATRAVYTLLPTPVVNAAQVTVDMTRTLVFVNTTIAEARKKLAASVDLYSELVGYRDEEGFAAVNASLVCN